MHSLHWRSCGVELVLVVVTAPGGVWVVPDWDLDAVLLFFCFNLELDLD